MPAPENQQWQRALLWSAQGYDRNGEVTVTGTFREIPVEWEDRQRRMLDPQGNEVAVDASALVREDIPMGSILWLGSLDDLETELTGTGTGTDLQPDGDLHQVIATSKKPDPKARFFERRVGLRRRDGMPSVEA